MNYTTIKTVLLFLLVAPLTNAQLINTQMDYNVLGSNTVEYIAQAEGATKDQIYAAIKKYVATSYGNSNQVIKSSDLEIGQIIWKGNFNIDLVNDIKEDYKNTNSVPEKINTTISHTVEVDIKDGRYKIVYEVNGLDYENKMLGNFSIPALTFDDSNPFDNPIFMEEMEGFYKKMMLGKKRRINLLEIQKGNYYELQSEYKQAVIGQIIAIEKSVNDDIKKGDW